MVSYTKARAESLGIECEVGMMQRTERVVYLGVLSTFNFLGNIVAYMLGFGSQNDYLLKLSVILLFVFSFYTSVQRMRHVMGEIERREASEGEGGSSV